MNELLANALAAHGGLDRWNKLSKVSATIVAGGGLLPMRGLDVDPMPLQGTVTTHSESTVIEPFGRPDWRMIFTPDRVALETTTGALVNERLDPRAAFAGHTMNTAWDLLHRAYFNGYARWTYLNTPFLIALPGFEVIEIPPWREGSEKWRGLRARFPDGLASHSKEQDFYFGDDFLLRRHDYHLEIAGGVPVAQYVHEIVEADGFRFPTRLQRRVRVQPRARCCVDDAGIHRSRFSLNGCVSPLQLQRRGLGAGSIPCRHCGRYSPASWAKGFADRGNKHSEIGEGCVLVVFCEGPSLRSKLNWRQKYHMEIGIDGFGAVISDPATGVTLSAVQRIHNLLEEIVLADRVGLDVFGVGEHHRSEFVDSAPSVILGAAATQTRSIRLTSAVTVLSAADPVRVFQEFATVDLISNGRAEIVAGRGSSIEAFPLFGFDLDDYDALFAEKLDLLLKIRESTRIHWTGRFRAPLTGQAVFPRPLQDPLPIWVGVGGTPASFARAGTLGLPLMVAIIGGEPKRFRPLIDLYREAGRRAGHSEEELIVGLHAIGFLGNTTQEAADDFFPGYAHAFTEIGRERGWPPATRAQFDAQRGPTGALLIGDAETVARKVLYFDKVLGGLSRITFQMGVSALPHERMSRSIEILGTRVAPIVRKQLASQQRSEGSTVPPSK